MDHVGSEPSLDYRKSSGEPRELDGVGRWDKRKIQAKRMVLQNAFLFFLSYARLNTQILLIIE